MGLGKVFLIFCSLCAFGIYFKLKVHMAAIYALGSLKVQHKKMWMWFSANCTAPIGNASAENFPPNYQQSLNFPSNIHVCLIMHLRNMGNTLSLNDIYTRATNESEVEKK